MYPLLYFLIFTLTAASNDYGVFYSQYSITGEFDEAAGKTTSVLTRDIPLNIGYTTEVSVFVGDVLQHGYNLTINQDAKLSQMCDYTFSVVDYDAKSDYLDCKKKDQPYCKREGWSYQNLYREKDRKDNQYDDDDPVPYKDWFDHGAIGMNAAAGSTGVYSINDGHRGIYCALIPSETDYQFQVFNCARGVYDFTLTLELFDDQKLPIGTTIMPLTEINNFYSDANINLQADMVNIGYTGVNDRVLIVKQNTSVSGAYAGYPDYNTVTQFVNSLGEPIGTGPTKGSVGKSITVNFDSDSGGYYDSGNYDGFCTFPSYVNFQPTQLTAGYLPLETSTGCLHELSVSDPEIRSFSRDAATPGAPECTSGYGCLSFNYRHPSPLSITSYNCRDNTLHIRLDLIGPGVAEITTTSFTASDIISAKGTGVSGVTGSGFVSLTSKVAGTSATKNCGIIVPSSIITIPEANTPTVVPVIFTTALASRLCLSDGTTINVDIDNVKPPDEYGPNETPGNQSPDKPTTDRPGIFATLGGILSFVFFTTTLIILGVLIALCLCCKKTDTNTIVESGMKTAPELAMAA